jgi:hypothetical protein
VIQAREAVVVAWERAATLINEVEVHANLPKREAQERVSKAEVESAASLASCREEADGFTRRVALLEGELMDARQAHDTAKANFQGLLDRADDIDRWREDAER